MREIESIEKATLTRKFKDGSVSGSGRGFTAVGVHVFVHLLPTTPIDEVVIRSVKWNGNPNDEKIYGLLLSTVNRIVASFGASPAYVYFPEPMTIQIHSQPETLQFMVVPGINDKSNDFIEGEIEIDMEFITYKKNY